MSATDIHLRNIEDGYAEVWKGRLKWGVVYREKHGSTRTGTRWFARNLRDRMVGGAITRDEAVQLLVKAPRL